MTQCGYILITCSKCLSSSKAWTNYNARVTHVCGLPVVFTYSLKAETESLLLLSKTGSFSDDQKPSLENNPERWCRSKITARHFHCNSVERAEKISGIEIHVSQLAGGRGLAPPAECARAIGRQAVTLRACRRVART